MIDNDVDTRNTLFNTYNRISNIEEPMEYNISDEAISNAIIKDFYASGEHTNGSPFIYTYDITPYFDKVGNGVYSITLFDNYTAANKVYDN
jgi:hypothetical protein